LLLFGASPTLSSIVIFSDVPSEPLLPLSITVQVVINVEFSLLQYPTGESEDKSVGTPEL
jgi:hypothetical protein